MESLVHLERTNFFNCPKAVIWGNFNHAKEEDENYKFLLKMIAEKMDMYNIPLIHSEDFGHGKKNLPLPFNTPACFCK